MEDEYVYVKVKLYLKPGQTEDSIQEIVQEVDYSFNHEQVIETEIVDIYDAQTGGRSEADKLPIGNSP